MFHNANFEWGSDPKSLLVKDRDPGSDILVTKTKTKTNQIS